MFPQRYAWRHGVSQLGTTPNETIAWVKVEDNSGTNRHEQELLRHPDSFYALLHPCSWMTRVIFDSSFQCLQMLFLPVYYTTCESKSDRRS